MSRANIIYRMEKHYRELATEIHQRAELGEFLPDGWGSD